MKNIFVQWPTLNTNSIVRYLRVTSPSPACNNFFSVQITTSRTQRTQTESVHPAQLELVLPSALNDGKSSTSCEVTSFSGRESIGPRSIPACCLFAPSATAAGLGDVSEPQASILRLARALVSLALSDSVNCQWVNAGVAPGIARDDDGDDGKLGDVSGENWAMLPERRSRTEY